ncbi:glycerophosphoryl diester phosphodiesterase [Azospira sp. I13]|uniref:glycerophosphodiester phosphodiesterase family protein n=1 Tax=Azospira sp. I13 TaxID=1765050 RepID=UPI000D4B02C7|nr:glycerophosphodiester phosphodiesterase family protein [Azospira sp. I13]GBG03153.1 glycerophosphoryl diester phosphodiesterase [Azospira sp. I13]
MGGTPTSATPAPEAGVVVSTLGYPRLIAHRGGGSRAPENTLAAIRAGHAAGFRGVEFDAMLSRDGVPFLIHDDTLERTSNGHGPVAQASAAALARLDAGSWHSPAFRGEPLPTLADALALCRQLDLWVNLEIKPGPGREAETGAAVAQVARVAGASLVCRVPRNMSSAEPCPAATEALPPARGLVLSSFSTAALKSARQVAPELPRAWLVERVPEDWQQTLQALGAVALHCHHEALTPALAAEIIAAGYALACYTVNEQARMMTLAQWGVTALFTDRLDLAGAF